MIGRGHYYRVDAALRQQVVIVKVRLGVRRILERGSHVGLVDFGNGHTHRTHLLEIAIQISAAPARARAENTRPRGCPPPPETGPPSRNPRTARLPARSENPRPSPR